MVFVYIRIIDFGFKALNSDYTVKLKPQSIRPGVIISKCDQAWGTQIWAKSKESAIKAWDEHFSNPDQHN